MWSDDDSKCPDARIIFVDTETSNWTYDPVRGQFFWHRFFSHQPDLNSAWATTPGWATPCRTCRGRSDRDAVRTPVQRTPDRGAGFSSRDPGRIHPPAITDPVHGCQGVNTAAWGARFRVIGALLEPADASRHGFHWFELTHDVEDGDR